jgi:hypothetical protein
MAGKPDFDPGQAARGHKLTISEVLAEYLRMERGRLAPKTHARYCPRTGSRLPSATWFWPTKAPAKVFGKPS